LESIAGYRRAPAVKFTIKSDGSVAEVRLQRGSGSPGIDRFALETAGKWKFNSRPGCPAVESQTKLLIDWTA
jgi:TonB family protein